MKSPMKATGILLSLSECSAMLVPSSTSSANRLGPGGSRGWCFPVVGRRTLGRKLKQRSGGIVLAPDTAHTPATDSDLWLNSTP